MERNLTQGPITKTLIRFACPMILGNLLQQVYNLADAFIVGRFVGPEALAAVGSAYTLMTFLNSVIIGLCMGSGALVSFYYGMDSRQKLRDCVQLSFVLIGGVTVGLTGASFALLKQILKLLRVPEELVPMMGRYVFLILFGLIFTFLYNYYAYLLRAVGNSAAALYVLGGAALLNVGLDFLFVVRFHWGIAGAAVATVAAQGCAGVALARYAWRTVPAFRFSPRALRWEKGTAGEILQLSAASCVQQSVMNLGILMIQGLVNSFGAQVMAAFAAAVKVDSFAYMPAQEFGNAYSLFISQNFGAGQRERVRTGTKRAVALSAVFCLAISLLVWLLAENLMGIFIASEQREIIAIGSRYLRIEGAFYVGIGVLFLFYGYFRGINHPEISLLLTIISLGTRVVLAYILAPRPAIGVAGIWAAIPIGWALADLVGLVCMHRVLPETDGGSTQRVSRPEDAD